MNANLWYLQFKVCISELCVLMVFQVLHAVGVLRVQQPTFGMFHTRRWNHDLVNLQELSSIVRQISQFFLILMYINDIVSLADVADRLVASPYRVYGSRLRISTWHPLMRKDKNCAWIVRRILAECMTASKSSKAIRISMEFIPCFPMNMIFQADSSW